VRQKRIGEIEERERERERVTVTTKIKLLTSLKIPQNARKKFCSVIRTDHSHEICWKNIIENFVFFFFRLSKTLSS